MIRTIKTVRRVTHTVVVTLARTENSFIVVGKPDKVNTVALGIVSVYLLSSL
jgi:hypothetical protein